MAFFSRYWIVIGSMVVMALILLVPDVSVAQSTFNVCSGNECTSCHFVKLIENVLDFLIVLSVLFATIMFVYAGFMMVTAAGNMGQVTKARAIFVDVVIGIVIVLSGYMIVDTVMKFIVGDDLLGGGPWNKIDCSRSQNPDPTTPGMWAPNSDVRVRPDGVMVDGNGNPIPPGVAKSIAEAMALAEGMDTSAGPANGKLACVWAVNRVLVAAGLAPFGTDNVFSAENELRSGRGTQITSQSESRRGDLVIVTEGTNRGHIGICMNDGCGQVISNSSSRGRFGWITQNAGFTPSYNAPGRIYRVTR